MIVLPKLWSQALGHWIVSYLMLAQCGIWASLGAHKVEFVGGIEEENRLISHVCWFQTN